MALNSGTGRERFQRLVDAKLKDALDRPDVFLIAWGKGEPR
jgi:hypothetical protein